MAEIDTAAELILQPTVVAALVPASLALVTATITYTWTFLQARHQHISTRKRTIIALYTEIELNLRDIGDTLGSTDWDEIGRQIEQRQEYFPIYAVYSRNMRFYDRNHVEELDLPPTTLSAIVEFYSALNSVYITIDSIQSKVFAAISAKGRRQVLDDLAKSIKKSRSCGNRALHAMEITLPHDWLHRNGAPLRLTL